MKFSSAQLICIAFTLQSETFEIHLLARAITKLLIWLSEQHIWVERTRPLGTKACTFIEECDIHFHWNVLINANTIMRLFITLMYECYQALVFSLRFLSSQELIRLCWPFPLCWTLRIHFWGQPNRHARSSDSTKASGTSKVQQTKWARWLQYLQRFVDVSTSELILKSGMWKQREVETSCEQIEIDLQSIMGAVCLYGLTPWSSHVVLVRWLARGWNVVPAPTSFDVYSDIRGI